MENLIQDQKPLNSVSALLKNRSLRLADYRLLGELLGRLSSDSYSPISTVEIGAEIGLDRTSISASLGRLEEAKIIVRGPKIGRLYTYRLIWSL